MPTAGGCWDEIPGAGDASYGHVVGEGEKVQAIRCGPLA